MTSPQEQKPVEVTKVDVKPNSPAQYEASIEPSEGAIVEVQLGWRTWAVVFISAYLT